MLEVSNYLSGRLQVSVIPEEMRASHWVYAPKVVDLQLNTVVLDLTGSSWDLLMVLETSTTMVLHMRKYPGDEEPIQVTIEPLERGVSIDGDVF
jgi:hypothetical protein